jgi:hypothetical protein
MRDRKQRNQADLRTFLLDKSDLLDMIVTQSRKVDGVVIVDGQNIARKVLPPNSGFKARNDYIYSPAIKEYVLATYFPYSRPERILWIIVSQTDIINGNILTSTKSDDGMTFNINIGCRTRNGLECHRYTSQKKSPWNSNPMDDLFMKDLYMYLIRLRIDEIENISTHIMQKLKQGELKISQLKSMYRQDEEDQIDYTDYQGAKNMLQNAMRKLPNIRRSNIGKPYLVSKDGMDDYKIRHRQKSIS